MGKVLAILRSEPIRAILYPVLVGLAAVLVARGGIDQLSADTIIGIVAVLLGIPAAEVARSQVRPVRKDSERSNSVVE